MDMSKAFDKSNHDILLDELERYGIRGVALDLLKSYLVGRKQCTETVHTINGITKPYRASTMIVQRGIPQGSILGHFLYIVCVNSLRTPEKTFCS